MKHIICLFLLTVIVAGCDPFGDSKNEQLALERQYREDVHRERDEQEKFAKALTEYANGKHKLVKETIGRLDGDVRTLKEDVGKLSKVILSDDDEKDSAGKELPREVKLLRLLRNPEVNNMAKKYLSADFALIQHEFVDRVRDARADEGRYWKALAQSEVNYSEALRESQKWVNATKEQRDAEIARVERQLDVLENARVDLHKRFQSLTKKTLVGNTSMERDRREQMEILERKISDADTEIYRKRRQIDFLRNPTANAGMENLAATRKQSVKREASALRDRELNTIDRHYKPKATVAEIVAEISGKTIEKLQGAIAEKCLAAEKELADAKRKEVAIRECLLAIPVSNMNELKALRSKIDK